MSEVRLVKFEILIEDINEIVFPEHAMTEAKRQNVALGLIFDYDACNEYAKIIIDKSELEFNIGCSIASLSDIKTKIEYAKDLVLFHRWTSDRYRFIFWSLMILTVDKNNAEEYLSLICDFAKMLRITIEEFEDIIYVIKCIYNEVDKKYIFKSESIPSVLGGIFDLYGGQDIEEFVKV